MPQTHFTLGEALGKAIGGTLSNDSFEKGQNDGAMIAYRKEAARKMSAEAQAAQRLNELQSDDSLMSSALLSAELKPNQRAMFDLYKQTGGIGDGVFQQPNDGYAIPAPKAAPSTLLASPEYLTSAKPDSFGELLKQNAPQGRSLPLAVPDEFKGKAETALHVMAKLQQALALGDKSVDGATKAAILQQVSAGGGTTGNALAGLLDKGKTQFDPQATGVTNVLTGEQMLNDIGRSQIVENNAQAQKAATGGKAPSDEFKAMRDDIRADWKATQINELTGKLKTDGIDYEPYTRLWLKQYNIPEEDYFNGVNPVASPEPPPKNAKGWILHTDSKGNRAYVSPDRKQFEEVK